jgi:hypothetical protein
VGISYNAGVLQTAALDFLPLHERSDFGRGAFFFLPNTIIKASKYLDRFRIARFFRLQLLIFSQGIHQNDCLPPQSVIACCTAFFKRRPSA